MQNNKIDPIICGNQLRGRVHWYPIDTEEVWKKHMSDDATRECMVYNGWDQPDSIVYDINDHGFRESRDYDQLVDSDQPFGIALGCSCTFGVGLKQEQTWVYQLSQYLQKPILNFGIPGGSPDSSFRVALHWIAQLKPSFVIYLEPPPGRLELIEGDFYKKYNCVPSKIIVAEDFFKIWYSTDHNWQLDYARNLRAIKQLAHENQSTFYHYRVFNDLDIHNSRFKQDPDRQKNLARDLSHPGPFYNKLFAERLAGEIS